MEQIGPRHESETQRWARLEDLLVLCQGGIRGMDAEQLRELAALYRLVSLDLANHSRKGTTGPTRPYLNGLLAKARRVVYQRPATRLRWEGLWDIIARDFPRALRAERGMMTLSAVAMFLPAIIGFIAMAVDPAWMRSLFPSLFQMMEAQGYASQETPDALATAIGEGQFASASAFIAANNIRVSILVYGLGISFGLGTLYFMAQTGAMVGIVAYYYLTRGPEFVEYFLAGILPHGIWELTAIVIAGAAGLMLGRAMLFPGDLARTEALRRVAPKTLPMIGGVILMLLVAGAIEGFITPHKTMDPYLKMFIGIGSGVIFWFYVILAGHPTTKPKSNPVPIGLATPRER